MIELYRASREAFIICFVGTFSDRGYENACLHIQLQNYDIIVVIQQRCQQQSIAGLSAEDGLPKAHAGKEGVCTKRLAMHFSRRGSQFSMQRSMWKWAPTIKHKGAKLSKFWEKHQQVF